MRGRLSLAFSVGVICFVIGTLCGHETDQFTLPEGRRFADVGRALNEWAYDAIARGVKKVNARLSSQRGRSGPADLSTPQAQDDIVRAVNAEFGSAFDVIEGWERLLNSSKFMQKHPGRVTAYKQNLGNIYQHVHFPLDPRQFFRLFQASTFMAYGTYMGTDKIGHFTDMGMHYYRAYTSAIRKGESEDAAFAAAIDVGTNHPLFGEKGMVGFGSAGDYSNADLVANFMGLLFYLNLTDEVSVKDQVRPPMLNREDGLWRIAPHVRANSDFFALFISDHWDEALNPGLFEKSMQNEIRKAVRERTSIVMNRRCDEHGNRRSREYFDAVLKDCKTYYGRDYGHMGADDELITLGNTCFDPLAADAPVGARNSWGLTLLHQAAMQGDSNQVRRLLQQGADVNAKVRSDEQYSPEWGNTPLHYAARDGRKDVVEQLLAAGAAANAANDRGVTPLHRALSYRELITLLIERGANVNVADGRGETPLHWAAQDGQADAVELLLLRGASVRVRNNAGLTPLHMAARSGSATACTKLAGYGGDVNAATHHGMTPLHLAAAHGHHTVVEAILATAVNVEVNDQFRLTALHEAARHGRTDIGELLLARGANAAATDVDGNTPLHLAVRHDYTAVATALLERGASLDVQNRNGQTPLHEAALAGSAELVALLLERGARPDVRNQRGMIPAQIASDHKRSEIVALFNERSERSRPARNEGRP